MVNVEYEYSEHLVAVIPSIALTWYAPIEDEEFQRASSPRAPEQRKQIRAWAAMLNAPRPTQATD